MFILIYCILYTLKQYGGCLFYYIHTEQDVYFNILYIIYTKTVWSNSMEDVYFTIYTKQVYTMFILIYCIMTMTSLF